MPTNTYSGSIDQPAERVWEFLADIRNLPRYLPLMTAARVSDDGGVEIETQVKGRVHLLPAWFRPDAAARRIEWGSVDAPGYHGWLTVTASADGSAVVDYSITSPREHTLEPYFRAATTFVETALASN